MAHYPINLDLRGRRCVVIGGGSVAERKVKTLLEFDADVIVVSPKITSELRKLVDSGFVEYIGGVFTPSVLDDVILAIAATDDKETNEAIYAESAARNIFVNVVDDPDLCTFFAPAVVRRGDFIISVSTSGKSPAMARNVRECLDSQFGSEYGELADILGELRDEVKARYSEMAERNGAFLRIIKSDVPELLAQGKPEEARRRARQCI